MQQPHRIIYFSSILALFTTYNSNSNELQTSTDQAVFSLPSVHLTPLQRSTNPLAASNTASTTVTEANTTNYFKLSLSAALSTAATVSYTTKEGTATAGSDYTKKSGTATIPAGETSILIGVNILEDTAAESSETFSLVITNPTGGAFASGVTELSTTHTILDDDSSTNSTSGLSLSSNAFKNTGSDNFVLPLQYTCDGASGGTSPTLSWSNIPSTATHLVLTMNDGTHPNFTLFNIATSNSTLPEGSLTLGTMATGDNASYVVPCGTNGDTTTYTFTLYAISSALSLSASATQAQVISAANDVLVEKTTLTTQRTRRANNTSYAPSSGTTSCTEKTAHFNQYSRLHRKLECDETNNKMSIISYIGDGLKTAESKQQVQVGITSWIGRLALPTESGHSIKITPSYLTGVNNNLRCDGVETLGITVDGQTILPYYKQTREGGSSASCGPTDGSDYSGRDTVVLGEVDQCYGHAPNGEGYHMHGAPICLMDVHDPSKPIAYMTDGIPLYFGEGGGQITDTTHGKAVGSAVTQINYGGGLYEHLSYLPTDRALNKCNAYDINGDGAVSGYVYYTTKDAPYAIGCYMGTAEDFGNPGAENTRYPKFTTKEGVTDQREGWLGQVLSEPMKGEIISNTVGTFNGNTYNITDFTVTDTALSFLTAGNTAQVLWRVTSTNDATTCFEFRYRKDKNDTSNDETETICSDKAVPSTTLDFTPFGSSSTTSSTSTSTSSTSTSTSSARSFKLEAWADNWFAAYSGETLIVEDSVPITTEKSFNAETATFTATYPIKLNVILKDFKENDTGLEYIGTNRQQTGDGGFIAQITDMTSGKVIAVSNSSWKCDVLHNAPLDTSCASESSPVAGTAPCLFESSAEPSTWKSDSYDDSSWSSATEYTSADVNPKDGYDGISWDSSAKLIWGPNLITNNTLLCRVTIEAP